MPHITSASSLVQSFTLVELLIVIGILAILTAATVLILNPAQRLQEARDSQRIQELTSLEKSISLLLTQNPDISIGTASTVYVSIPDTSSTCSNLGLPTLPTGYAYNCVTTANLRNTNGTGWIPINFSSSPVSSLPQLPIDPTNTTSSGLYYTYMMGGSFEIAAGLESKKYKLGGDKDAASTDGGSFTGLFEKGTDKSLIPVEYGDPSLVGYWNFDEGSGAIAYDRSGRGNTGTLTGGPSWQSGSNCRSGACLYFDGMDDYVRIPNQMPTQTTHGPISISLWFYEPSLPSSIKRIFSDNCMEMGISGDTATIYGSAYSSVSGGAMVANAWYHAVLTHEHPNGLTNTVIKMYVNGVLKNTVQRTISTENGYMDLPFAVGVDPCSSGLSGFFNGYVDSVRVYNKALTAEEVEALYLSAK